MHAADIFDRCRRMRLALLVCMLALAAPAAAEPFDRSVWIADFEQMKQAITRESPNLEWAVERGLDLNAVEQRARSRLAAATNDAAAHSALERFVRNFADGHMELSWPASPPASAGAPAARSTCAELGYWRAPDEYGIAARLPGYRPVGPQEDHVRAGMVQVAGQAMGVLRIPLFAPSDGQCAAVLRERGMPPNAPCDEQCADVVSRRADDLFLAVIADRLRLLTEAGADLLLLDVASNGGGSDTSIAVARMIGGAGVSTPRLAFVRNSARAKDLEEDEAVVRAGLAQATPEERLLIRSILGNYTDARAEAVKPCDLSPLWRGQPVGCSNLVRGSFYAGGLTPLDSFTRQRTGAWAEIISSTARFSYRPGQWTKPVLVLVDQSSASSTELLAAMLQDAGRATIVGAPTLGAGCGWTLPRQDVVLRHSGARLSIPDCARFRRDGRNEIDGIEPDVLVGFRPFDTPRQKEQRLSARLPMAIEIALGLGR